METIQWVPSRNYYLDLNGGGDSSGALTGTAHHVSLKRANVGAI